MTTKEMIQQTEHWVKTFNPKAYVEQADPRCGRRFAVATKDEEGRPTYWTEFLPIKTLYEVVFALLRYDIFIKIKEA